MMSVKRRAKVNEIALAVFMGYSAVEHGPLRAVKYKNGNVHVYFTKAGERARSVMNEVLATFSKGHNAERLK